MYGLFFKETQNVRTKNIFNLKKIKYKNLTNLIIVDQNCI